MYIHVRDQNDNATYASTRWVPTVRHFLACEDVPGGSQQSGGKSFFLPGRTSLLAKMKLVGPSSQGETFSAKYSGPSGGYPLLGGGLIILRIMRRHFLAATVDPAVRLSTYNTLPMEVGR